METLTIDNQTMIPIADVAKQLGLSVQRIHQLCDNYNIHKVFINPKYSFMSIKDLERLKKIERINGRPSTKK